MLCVFVSAISTSEPDDLLSRNVVWTLRYQTTRRARKLLRWGRHQRHEMLYAYSARSLDSKQFFFGS